MTTGCHRSEGKTRGAKETVGGMLPTLIETERTVMRRAKRVRRCRREHRSWCLRARMGLGRAPRKHPEGKRNGNQTKGHRRKAYRGCAACTVPRAGRHLIGDEWHGALADKFAPRLQRDVRVGPASRHEAPALVEAEESNNPAREWWDRTTVTAADDCWARGII